MNRAADNPWLVNNKLSEGPPIRESRTSTGPSVYDNPYVSESLNVLKNSVPEFIKNNEEMSSKIIKISKASVKDGGDGAFYIFLKKKKNL